MEVMETDRIWTTQAKGNFVEGRELGYRVRGKAENLGLRKHRTQDNTRAQGAAFNKQVQT